MILDSNDFRLLDLEKILKEKDISTTYTDDNMRKAAVLLGDHFSLLKEYSREMYDICTQNSEIRGIKRIKKVLSKTKNLKSGKHVNIVYENISRNPKELSRIVTTYNNNVVKFMKKLSNEAKSLNMRRGTECCYCLEYDVEQKQYKYFFDTIFWDNQQVNWDIEIIFFILMKCDEILYKDGFKQASKDSSFKTPDYC